MQMQKNCARVVMVIKLSANIPLQNQWRELTHQSGPWQDCAADILGPLLGGENLLAIVDYYSIYFEVVILRSTTSTKVIDSIQPIFARFGVPHTLKTDNGPQFVSEDFKAFLAENGVEHRTTPPLWPQANGEVERQNRTLLKMIQVAQI